MKFVFSKNDDKVVFDYYEEGWEGDVNYSFLVSLRNIISWVE